MMTLETLFLCDPYHTIPYHVIRYHTNTILSGLHHEEEDHQTFFSMENKVGCMGMEWAVYTVSGFGGNKTCNESQPLLSPPSLPFPSLPDTGFSPKIESPTTRCDFFFFFFFEHQQLFVRLFFSFPTGSDVQRE
jgi:hypothetical protein